MKILLDTNIWRYIADSDAFEDLITTASDKSVELVVAPALVHEISQFQDEHLRKKILKMITNSNMIRLMPEAYLEAEEIKNVVVKYRHDWLIQVPDHTEVDNLISDWQRTKNGYWARAANDTSDPSTDESHRNKNEHELAKQESREIRKRMVDQKNTLPSDFDLKKIYYPFTNGQKESNVEHIEYWRVPSLYIFKSEFQIYTSPYREWLDYLIDVSKIEADPASLTRLWYHEISNDELPRQWLRGAFEFLQAFHKITSGTPGDSQLSSHLIDVDVVISSDRNFIRFIQQCKKDAPFEVAQGYLVRAGVDAIKDILRFMRELNN